MDLYTDAGIKRVEYENDFDLHISFIFKENDGSVVYKTSYNNMTTTHSTQGELIAIIHALRYYKLNINEDFLRIYTDSHSVKQLVNGKSESCKNDINQYLRVIWELLSDVDFSIYHIYSENNPADDLL